MRHKLGNGIYLAIVIVCAAVIGLSLAVSQAILDMTLRLP